MSARRTVAILALLAASACSGRSVPALTFADDVPAEFREVATSAWGRFGAAVPGLASCLRGVRVEIAWELGDRARYDPARGVVTVRVPGTAANLTSSLVHEFAHHLEFTCHEHRGLRARFLEASGLPLAAPWFRAARYEDVPSERFAEAVVIVVLGRPSGAAVPVGGEAVDVVRAWAAA